MSESMDPIAVRAGEAARLLGVSKPTLYQLAKREDFRAAFRCGGCTLYSVDGLRDWVKKQSEEASA